jgi:hypothetical protein
MVNKYKRTSNRQSWREDDMRNAIQAVEREEMGWLLASKTYNVPQATLRRRARNKNKFVKSVEKGLGRFRQCLDDSMEKDLVNHVLEQLESRLFGVTSVELRQLAFQIADANGIEHAFNQEKRIAGKERRRHPDLL